MALSPGPRVPSHTCGSPSRGIRWDKQNAVLRRNIQHVILTLIAGLPWLWQMRPRNLPGRDVCTASVLLWPSTPPPSTSTLSVFAVIGVLLASAAGTPLHPFHYHNAQSNIRLVLLLFPFGKILHALHSCSKPPSRHHRR